MIAINNKWSLGADSDNIILYRKAKPKKKGTEPTYRVSGYYATLHQALTALTNQGVRDTSLTSLKVLTAKLDEIYALIKTLPHIAVTDLKKK